MKINNDNERFTAENMLELIEEGSFQGRTIKAKTISAREISKMAKLGWKYIKMEPEDEILQCYFVRE